MPFETFGPFKVDLDVKLKMDFLTGQFDDQRPDLKHASGVYVFATSDKETSEPVYVGKAQRRSFGARIPKHLDIGKFEEIARNEDRELVLFLVAFLDENGEVVRATEDSAEELEIVDRWEGALIGLAAAPSDSLLLNKHRRMHTVIDELRAYLEEASQDSSTPAWQLARLLKV